MFLCNACLDAYTNAPSLMPSRGRCEGCGEVRSCSDIPSRYLQFRMRTILTFETPDELFAALPTHAGPWSSHSHVGGTLGTRCWAVAKTHIYDLPGFNERLQRHFRAEPPAASRPTSWDKIVRDDDD